MASQPAVYMFASKHSGTIYIGVTGNLVQRIWQHRNEVTQGFTQKYCVHKLVYYEIHDEMTEAILREKRLKKWNRGWKVNLIEAENSTWDLTFSQETVGATDRTTQTYSVLVAPTWTTLQNLRPNTKATGP